MDFIKNRFRILFMCISIVCANSTVIAAVDHLKLLNGLICLSPVIHLVEKYVAWYKNTMSVLPNASPFYRRYFDEALRSYGISNPQKISLKNDSSIGKNIGGNTTYLGVRFNEKILTKHSIAKRIYICYHEAAHIALGHVHKEIKSQAAITGASYLVSNLVSNGMLKIALTFSTVIGMTKLASKLGYYNQGKEGKEWLMCPTENEADAIAIEHLIKNGKYYIVEQLSQEYRDQYNKKLKDVNSRKKIGKNSPLIKELEQERIRFNRWKMLSEKAYKKVRSERTYSRTLSSLHDHKSRHVSSTKLFSR